MYKLLIFVPVLIPLMLNLHLLKKYGPSGRYKSSIANVVQFLLAWIIGYLTMEFFVLRAGIENKGDAYVGDIFLLLFVTFPLLVGSLFYISKFARELPIDPKMAVLGRVGSNKDSNSISSDIEEIKNSITEPSQNKPWSAPAVFLGFFLMSKLFTHLAFLLLPALIRTPFLLIVNLISLAILVFQFIQIGAYLSNRMFPSALKLIGWLVLALVIVFAYTKTRLHSIVTQTQSAIETRESLLPK